ncbi:MAG TPA: UPF0175 family protein [Nitrososphaeraceae archaeon]|nr:UPF0175 family protein [Nitrososphaeraceae archaeon]
MKSENKKIDSLHYPPEEKYFLVLLYAPNLSNKFAQPVRGNLWMQKEMFVLSKILDELNDLKFDEHLFGPHSPILESIQNQYLNSKVIKQQYLNGPITLTDNGIELVKSIWDKISDEKKKLILEVKQFLNDMRTWELISFIYSSYPETTKNSDVLEKFHSERLNSAISLFKKKKISLEKAASISGKTLEDFIILLKEKKIKAFEVDESTLREDLSFFENTARC